LSLKLVPAARETGKLLGRNLNACRIGFELGASDRKVSVVVDGAPVYSEEVIRKPRKNSIPGRFLARDAEGGRQIMIQFFLMPGMATPTTTSSSP
jgi:hypothetical protein